MLSLSGKRFGVIPLFDPAEGMLVRAPLGNGPGWWAGAPGATFDPQTDTFYLVYRQRQPRDLGRGIELRIMASDNGVAFKDIWALPKMSLDALSLERCSLVRGLDGLWHLYLAYVGASDRRWRIGHLKASEPDRFELSQLKPLLTADMIGAEGVKDPAVFVIGRMCYLLASYAVRLPDRSEEDRERFHAEGDIYNTGETLSRTGAAISGDGHRFQWLGDVSPVSNYLPTDAPDVGDSAPDSSQAWDAYCRRIGSLLPLDHSGYLAFYDGSASVAENYEEKTGIAITFDLKTYYSLTPDAPALRSPHAGGSLRYVDVLPVGRELFYYYELARPDGAHELRVSVVERD